jgi:hypothetical protein
MIVKIDALTYPQSGIYEMKILASDASKKIVKIDALTVAQPLRSGAAPHWRACDG